MRRRTYFVLLSTIIMSGCLQSEKSSEPIANDQPDSDLTVIITAEAGFDPDSIEISSNDTITWVNESTRNQTITSDEDTLPEDGEYFSSGGFSREATANVMFPLQGRVNVNDTYSHTFNTPGKYKYYSIPSGIEGEVIVSE